MSEGSTSESEKSKRVGMTRLFMGKPHLWAGSMRKRKSVEILEQGEREKRCFDSASGARSFQWLWLGDESNDAQLASTVWTNERVGKVDASDQMSPSFSQCGPLLWGEGGVDWFWGRAFVCESGQSQVGLGSIRPGFG